MTQFQAIITVLVAVCGLLVTVLGYIIKMASKWTAIEIKLTSLIEDMGNLSVSNLSEHTEFKTRLTALERWMYAVQGTPRRRGFLGD